MKKFLLILSVALLSQAPVWAYDFSAENEDSVTIYYNITSADDKTVEVTYLYTGFLNQFTYYNTVVIPTSVTSDDVTYSVTSIGSDAFFNCYYLSSVTIPNSVTTIGYEAFYYCTDLTTMTIGNSVESIGDYAFGRCYNVESIAIITPEPPTCDDNTFNEISTHCTLYVPAGSKDAYASADYWSVFTDIEELPAAGTKIEVDGFYYNILSDTDVEVTWGGNSGTYGTSEYTGEMTIPSSTFYAPLTYDVTGIGDNAFYSCRTLTGITIPNSVERIGNDAFGGCFELESVTWGSGVKALGEYAFENCFSLTEITIPDSVETIGYEAFFNCSALESVTIGSGVKEIGAAPFASCSVLAKLEVSEDNEYYCSVDNVLYTKDMTTLVTYAAALEAETYEIPETVTAIGDCAFADATNLTSINIPDNVETMAYLVFSGCSGLQTATVGNGVETLPYCVFGNCTALTSVVLGSNVTEIENFAFSFSSGIQSVTCINPEPPTCGNDAFYEVDTSSATLYVPAGSKEAYSTAEVWKDFGTIEEIVEPTLTIADAADVTADSATLTGTVTKGTLDIIAQGFEYWTEDGDVETLECEGDELTATLTELADNTTYAFRAYATTLGATSYSETLYFTTLNATLRDSLASEIEEVQTELEDAWDTITTDYADVADNYEDDYEALKDELDNLSETLDNAYNDGTLNDELAEEMRAELEEIEQKIAEMLDSAKEAHETTGIDGILSDDAEVEAIYDLNGIRVSSPVKGNVYIILYSDGTTQKVLVK